MNRRQLLAVWVSLTALPIAWPMARAAEPPLVMLVDGSTEMPHAKFNGQQVVDGLQFHVAAELGRRLGRAIQLRAVPRRRMSLLLEQGQEADLACDYMPRWLEGDLQWSRPVFDRIDVVITPRAAPAPARLHDLAGQRVGTVAGYAYPELQEQLGQAFVRDDAPQLEASLRKLALGRVAHAVVGRETLEYLMKAGLFTLDVHPPLVVGRMSTSCALSPHSALSLPTLDAALSAMTSDGTVHRLWARYR